LLSLKGSQASQTADEQFLELPEQPSARTEWCRKKDPINIAEHQYF